MSLWQVVIACALAWISGALFAASFRGGFFRHAPGPAGRSPFAERDAYDAGDWRGITAPATVVQLALLVAFIAAAMTLIVVNI